MKWVKLLTDDDFLAIFSKLARIAGFRLTNGIATKKWIDSAMCKDVAVSDFVLINAIVQTDYNDLAIQYISLTDFSVCPFWDNNNLEIYDEIYCEYMTKKFGQDYSHDYIARQNEDKHEKQ